MNRVGKIVLISDITRSDRERLPDWRAEDEREPASLPGIWAAVLVAAAFWAAVAWWVFA
jgi:hypothetical protein